MHYICSTTPQKFSWLTTPIWCNCASSTKPHIVYGAGSGSSVCPDQSFPVSFPYNFMHLIWGNLIPNLILLWTRNFKDLDHDNEGYVLAPKVWQAIGVATLDAGKTFLPPLDLGFQILQQRNRRWQLKPIQSGCCILPLLFLMARLPMTNITNISFSWFNLLHFASNLKLPKIKLMTLREVYRSVKVYEWYKLLSLPDAIWQVSRIYYQHMPNYVTSCLTMLHVAHSQFMLCYILLQPSELWAQFGLIGHMPLQWDPAQHQRPMVPLCKH